jgi:spore coat protein U-like protein
VDDVPAMTGEVNPVISSVFAAAAFTVMLKLAVSAACAVSVIVTLSFPAVFRMTSKAWVPASVEVNV